MLFRCLIFISLFYLPFTFAKSYETKHFICNDLKIENQENKSLSDKCQLKPLVKQKLLEGLDKRLKNPLSSPYARDFFKLLKNLKDVDSELYSYMIKRLKSNDEIQTLLLKILKKRESLLRNIIALLFDSEKLRNKHLFIKIYILLSDLKQFISDLKQLKEDNFLQKITHYAFYKEIYGENQKFRKLIWDKVTKIFEKVNGQSDSEINYKATLLLSLSIHEYLNNEQGVQLLKKMFKGDYLSSKMAQVRRAAVWAAGKIGEKGLPILKEALADPDRYVRAETALAVVGIGEKGLPILEQAIKDSNYSVQKKAIQATGKIGEKGLPILKQALKDPDSIVQKKAVKAMLGTGEKGLPILKQALKDSNHSVQKREIILAAGQAGEKSLPFLEHTIKDSDPYVRENTAFAVIGIGEKGLPILEQALKDSNSYVQEEAASTVRTIIRLASGKIDGPFGFNFTKKPPQEVENFNEKLRKVIEDLHFSDPDISKKNLDDFSEGVKGYSAPADIVGNYSHPALLEELKKLEKDIWTVEIVQEKILPMLKRVLTDKRLKSETKQEIQAIMSEN